MEGARAAPGAVKAKRKRGGRETTALLTIPSDPKALGKLMMRLEEQMLEHAKNLEFEEAAQLRDQLKEVRDAQLVNPA